MITVERLKRRKLREAQITFNAPLCCRKKGKFLKGRRVPRRKKEENRGKKKLACETGKSTT